MVEWRLDCEDCPHLTVVGLHDTGPWINTVILSRLVVRRSGLLHFELAWVNFRVAIVFVCVLNEKMNGPT